MSPVCAPEAAAWQSCPPSATGPAIAAIRDRSVAGGQISTSGPPAETRSASAATSASAAPVPFIFQFPAASFRRIAVFLRFVASDRPGDR